MVFLYRKRSGEVIGVSTDANAYTGAIDTDFFDVAVDPAVPDGPDLAVAKFYDSVAHIVRNASIFESDGFAAARTTDDNLVNRKLAIALATTNPVQRKILVGIVSVLVDELNVLRQWITNYRSEVAAATSLANLQTRVANNTLALPDRTLAQAKTVLQSRVNDGTVD